MKIVKKILIFLLIVFMIMQFFGPDRNEGDLSSLDAFISDTNPPDDVHQTLKMACFDCHSNKTRYPWYNRITPVNYWIADHVRHGKGEFNMSEWNTYSDKKKDHKLEEVVEEVKKKHMPLDSYTWIHSDAKLTEEQISALAGWADRARLKYNLKGKPN
ncbi:MAG: heme-binding domain-containing protein [Flavobacteriaceae bacterium]|nr:heme-binding domain-containing protein [Bacteroidia bacterium]NNF82275.1 heme-binding domain-containing protein [Flavobacteriaceae bacterium]NNK69900.1 heme-binding domain-containing protein [Flavobacteriaceae bacterium]NNL80668.1 heme-binding domain-containing protein [Flavobacteriaceae bacterium]